MAAILIPIFILIAIVLLSPGTGIVKNLNFSSFSELYPTALIKGQIPPPKLPSQTPQTQFQQIPAPAPSSASQQLNELTVSPYLGKIKISQLTLPSAFLSSSFTLTPKLIEGEKINITNWHFETTLGRYTIPQGIQMLKEDTETNIQEDIILESGQKLIISRTHNLDENLRENDWYVYLENEEFLLEMNDRVTLYDQNNSFVDQKIDSM